MAAASMQFGSGTGGATVSKNASCDAETPRNGVGEPVGSTLQQRERGIHAETPAPPGPARR